MPGLLSAAPPSPCEEKGSWEVPGPGDGASSSGRSRGLAALGPLRPGLGFTGVQSNLGHCKEKRALGPSCNAVAISAPTV